jgi:hypothetical protein
VDWKKHERALPLLEDLVMRDDATDDDHVLRAETMVAVGQTAEAESVLRRLLADRPVSMPALVALADLLAATGRNDEARRVARTAIDLDADAFMPLQILYRAASADSAEAAEQALRDVAAAHPTACGPFIVLGRIAEATDPELAARIYAEGLARSPQHETLLGCVTSNLMSRGRFDEVIERFDSVVSDGYLMEFALYANVAEAHLARGNTARVLGIYNERVQRGPEMHRRMARQKITELKERLARKAAGGSASPGPRKS